MYITSSQPGFEANYTIPNQEDKSQQHTLLDFGSLSLLKFNNQILKAISVIELEQQAMVRKLIELQKMLGSQSVCFELEPNDTIVTSSDELLVQKLTEALDKSRSVPDFNIGKLCLEVGLSRSQLHRKVKALTGLSTGGLIRSFRLKYAKKLIEKNFGNMAQVAYECGFNNPSYFAECFKKQYGVLPSQYAKSGTPK